MTRQSKVISLLIATMVCLFSTNLFAETKSFQDYLDTAKEAYDKKDYEEAIRNLLLANSVENNARLLFNVAKSYQKLDQCDKAIVYFMSFRRQPTAGADLRQQALKEIKKSRSCQTIKPLAGRFFFKTSPSGAAVQMDGIDLGVTPLEVAGFKSGPHEVTFTLEGHKTASRSFETLAGNDQLVSQELVIEPTVDITNTVVDPEENLEEPEEAPNDDLIPLIIAGSVTTLGVGILGYAVYTDTVTIVDLKEERDALKAPDSAESKALTEDISDSITVSLTSYIVGGTLVAGGVGYLVYILATGSDAAEDEIVVAPTFSEHGYGLNFSSNF